MCAYPANAIPKPNNSAQIPQLQDRIDHLESLVLNLMRQTQATPSSAAASPPEEPTRPCHSSSPSISGNDSERPVAAICETQRDVSPSPSDYGSIRIQRTGVSYVSSAHWAAVLDSIAELRTHFAQEDATNSRLPDPVEPLVNFPKPRLLYYSPLLDSRASILDAIPSRHVADRLISRYFNVLDIAPG